MSLSPFITLYRAVNPVVNRVKLQKMGNNANNIDMHKNFDLKKGNSTLFVD